MSISKYYKMDPDDATSVRLEQFPQSASALGIDADGNPIDAGDSIYKVKVNSSDATADYLANKLSDTLDVTWDAKSDNSALESTVIQLTGKGASLVIKHVPDAVGTELVHTVGPSISGFQYGRGCTPGYTYKLSEISGQKERIHTWIAQSSNGKMYRSYDNFQTGHLDTGLVDGAGSTIASNQYGAQCLAYVKLVDGSYVWVVFVGNSSGYFKCPDVPSSYNNDGSFVSGAWSWVDFVDSGLSFPGAPPYHNICHLAQATNGGVFVTSSFTSRIFYSEDLLTWTAVAVSSSGEIAGICTDNYGTYLGVQRNTGVIYRNNSELSGTFDETAWSPITSITVTDPSGVKTVTTNLPVNGGTWWAGFGCAYGLWVCTVAKKGSSSDPVYAYSDDSINWYTYGGASDALISVWEMSTDGALWFGCPVGSASPLVYQLLVNSIPAKKRFIAEKGLMVVGDAFVQDLPSADVLGTDENGKLVAKSIVGSTLHASTMSIANATTSLMPSLVGERNEICVAFTVPSKLTVKSGTEFSCAMMLGGGGTIILTLRDANFNLIAKGQEYSDPDTIPQVLTTVLNYLANPITHDPVASFDLLPGVVYYLGINHSINGVLYIGTAASQNMNLHPFSAWKFDNIPMVDLAPDVLSGGSETLIRPYIAVTSE